MSLGGRKPKCWLYCCVRVLKVGYQKQNAFCRLIDYLNKYLLIYLPTDKALVEKLRVVGSELEGDVVQYT